MKEFFKKHRRLWLNVLTVSIVVLLVGLNFLFPYLAEKNADYIDLTPEGLYTVTDAMASVCSGLQGDITITFCDDPDRLMSYHDTRYVYVMAQQLAAQNANIHVETVNLSLNPTAVNRYKATSASFISPSDVIVSCGGRYRILGAQSFWTLGENATDTSEYYSFNGEYKLATALLSVTSLVQPIVCFAYGHGESIYVPENYTPTANQPADLRSDAWGHKENRSTFYSLMEMAGLKVQYINLDTEDIPDACALLVMDGPTRDYDIGDPNSIASGSNALRRIHEFLSRNKSAAWMLFKDPKADHLFHLEDLAEDWGIGFENGSHIKDEPTNTLPDADNTIRPNQAIVATLPDDPNATPYAIYGDLLKTGTPPRMVVKDTGAIYGAWHSESIGASGTQNVSAYYFDFMYSSEQSDKINIETGDYEAYDKAYPLAGLSMRMHQDTLTDTNVFAYFFGAASTELITNEYLSDAAFSNYDVMFATVRFVSRVDEYASMELGGTSLNASSVGGKVGGKPLVPVIIPADGYKSYGYVPSEDGTTTYYKLIKAYSLLDEDEAAKWISIFVTVPVLVAAVSGIIILVKRKSR